MPAVCGVEGGVGVSGHVDESDRSRCIQDGDL